MIEVIFGKQTFTLEETEFLAGTLDEWIEIKTGLLPSEYYLTQNGKRLREMDDGIFQRSVPIRLLERLTGGKGGFGSMLRAIGAQIEKTTNREACRDLSGRRLRDINEEKRLKAYLDKQKDALPDEAAKLQRKIDKLLAKPKHEFHDEEYNRTRSDLTQNVDEAVQEGFRKALEAEKAAAAASAALGGAAGVKRKNGAPGDEKSGKKKKKAKGALWLGADDLGSSSSASSDSESDSGGSDSVGSSSGTATSNEKCEPVQQADQQEREKVVVASSS